MFRVALMVIALVLLTIAAYWPVHRFGFVNYDDDQYVYSNPDVQTGFTAATVRNAFVTFRMGNWNPLLWISFYTDRLLFHLNPGAMHVENVLLHLISGLLLWRLLYVCTGALNRSFAVAALFLLHPMHVESVAWITERKDVLSTPLLLLATLAYVQFCRHPSQRRRWFAYAFMVLFFSLSLMAKTMGVTFPAILLLMDFWPLRRWPVRGWGRLIIEKIPLFILSIAATGLGLISQTSAGAASSLQAVGPLDRLCNALVGYFLYIIKLLVPVDLVIIYPLPDSRPVAAAIAAAILLVMVTALFYRLRRHQPYLIVGWLWFLVTLLPVIGLVQLGSAAMADRYSYLPSIGLTIGIVWFAADFLPNAMIAAAGGIVLVVFSVLTRAQTAYWRDSQTLFTHAVQVIDHNPVAHVGLGNDAFARHDVRLAVDECNLALRDGPNAEAYTGLGACWLGDDVPRAIENYRHAVALKPRSPLFQTNLAKALRLHGQWTEAEQHARAALNLQPDFEPARVELANILVKEAN